MMNSRENNCYLSALAILRGSGIDTSEIFKSLLRIKERNLISFVEWTPATLQVAISNESQTINNHISGLMLMNNTGITGIFQRTLDQYDRLRKRNAFLDIYKREKSFCDVLDDEFDSSREEVQSTIDEYKAVESSSYLRSLSSELTNIQEDIASTHNSILCT